MSVCIKQVLNIILFKKRKKKKNNKKIYLEISLDVDKKQV